MREFLAQFRSYFFSAAAFSLVINLLMLAPALFMLQVFDRVVSSRSVETLVMLFALDWRLALVAVFFLQWLVVSVTLRHLSESGFTTHM